MADFDYLAIDTKGRETRGHVRAPSIDDARVLLDRKRLYVVKVEPGSGPAPRGRPLLADLRFGRRKMNAKQLSLFIDRKIDERLRTNPTK